ncbi:MAG TPA: hypothetical protein PLD88_11690 [Candidatus Berkiella sp.]|nr:hypothetical protein [Candidatus Berkiella sp.]
MQPLTLQPYFMPNLPNPFSPQSVQKPSQEISCSITLNIPTILSQQPPLTLIFKQSIGEQLLTQSKNRESVPQKKSDANPHKKMVKKKVVDDDPEYLPRGLKNRRKIHNEKKNAKNSVTNAAEAVLKSEKAGNTYRIKSWVHTSS